MACSKLEVDLTNIELEHYDSATKLGGDDYGNVHAVRHRNSGERFAMKLLPINAETEKQLAEETGNSLKAIQRFELHAKTVSWRSCKNYLNTAQS